MRIVVGLIGLIVGVLGLLLAAGAQDGGIFFAGMLFFVFGIMLVFWLIGTADHGAPTRATKDERSAGTAPAHRQAAE